MSDDADRLARHRAERRAAFAEHHAALERTRAADQRQAQALIDGFVSALRARGVDPVPLRARVGGRARYRTGLMGWPLRADGSLAVDVDGRFYSLDVSAGPLAYLTGVRPDPLPPPLRVGVGARDGESFALTELIDRRLRET